MDVTALVSIVIPCDLGQVAVGGISEIDATTTVQEVVVSNDFVVVSGRAVLGFHPARHSGYQNEWLVPEKVPTICLFWEGSASPAGAPVTSLVQRTSPCTPIVYMREASCAIVGIARTD
jgi:hypothetical protein